MMDELPQILVDAIANYLLREFGLRLLPGDLNDPSHIPLAYTHADENEEYEIRMILNVPQLRLEQYINGRLTDVWGYESIEDMSEEIRCIDFSEMVALGPNAESIIYG